MSSIPEATAALRAELHRKGVERHVQDAFDNLASCLVLLVCVHELFLSLPDQLHRAEFFFPLGTDDTETLHCAPSTTSSVV